MENIVVIGAGGVGLETAWLIEKNNDIKPEYNILGYYDDNPELAKKSGMWINYLGKTEQLLEIDTDMNVVIAISNPKIKQKLYKKLSRNRRIKFPNIICNQLKIHKTNIIGFGNIIFPDVKITVNTRIGNFNLIAFQTTVGHGTIIGNYNSIYPGVTISGDVQMGDYIEIGTGSNIIQQITLNDSSIIGAGTVVIRDVTSGCTVVGSPAKIICKL